MTTERPRTDEELASLVHEKLKAASNFTPHTLAKSLGVQFGRILAALPEEMRSFAPGDAAIAIWEAMTEWEKATFIATTPGAIVEISCRLPKGKRSNGMYNLMDKQYPLGGHLLMGMVDSVCFVSGTVHGMESHSVQFLDAEGRQCFAVYLGRNEQREIIPAVREGFFALKAQYSL